MRKKDFLFSDEGLEFIVEDYDRFTGDDEIGRVRVTSTHLFNAKGERMELKLNPPRGHKASDVGTLFIRCKRATNYDRKFLSFAADPKNCDFLGVKKNVELLFSVKGGSKSVFSFGPPKYSMIESSGTDKGIKKVGTDSLSVNNTHFVHFFNQVSSCYCFCSILFVPSQTQSALQLQSGSLRKR